MNFPRLRTSTIASLAFVLACVCGLVQPAAAGIDVVTTLEIGAVVDSRCSIVAVGITFGNYFPGAANATVPLDATGIISIDCDAGKKADVRLGEGLYPAPGSTDTNPLRRMANGAARLNYNLYEDAARVTVWDNKARGVMVARTYPAILSVYGRIPAGQGVPSGAYSDSVVATIFF